MVVKKVVNDEINKKLKEVEEEIEGERETFNDEATLHDLNSQKEELCREKQTLDREIEEKKGDEEGNFFLKFIGNNNCLCR
mmetsp:Transcript_12789/g.10929  ORF Transcript_12789/g.10929 Transcript_12789/m.10929 type:complete len:81 (+) Transcript_12789:428-670(+)